MTISNTISNPASSASVADSNAVAVAAPRIWPIGLLAGAAASVATTVTAAVARAVDVSLTIDGESIPLLGFAQLTLVGALIGIALAAVLSRRSARPRTMFTRCTVALTMLSIVPDVMIDADAASKVVLAATHLIAAAIIIPSIARRLEA